jgi:hypothetical protein
MCSETIEQVLGGKMGNKMGEVEKHDRGSSKRKIELMSMNQMLLVQSSITRKN